MSLDVGDSLADRYLVLERIGSGGMGEVFLARDESLGRDVAIKVLLSSLGDDEGVLERFRREARALARLRNPGIIVLYDVIVADDGRLALVLEYVPGGSLETLIAAGPVPPSDVATIGVAAADALSDAHRAGIIHRDIKPSNILLDADGEARITDFGIARGAGDAGVTAQGEALGTPAYMAPEQALGQPATPATDLYSLGAVLYAAATGVPPFATAEGGLSAALAHVHQPVPDPRSVCPDVPEALAVAITRDAEGPGCAIRLRRRDGRGAPGRRGPSGHGPAGVRAAAPACSGRRGRNAAGPASDRGPEGSCGGLAGSSAGTRAGDGRGGAHGPGGGRAARRPAARPRRAPGIRGHGLRRAGSHGDRGSLARAEHIVASALT
ncbi:MAG: serine/threonine-protein kinase [bacterium]